MKGLKCLQKKTKTFLVDIPVKHAARARLPICHPHLIRAIGKVVVGASSKSRNKRKTDQPSVSTQRSLAVVLGFPGRKAQTSDTAQYSHTAFFSFLIFSAKILTFEGVQLSNTKSNAIIFISDDGALLQWSGTVRGLVLL